MKKVIVIGLRAVGVLFGLLVLLVCFVAYTTANKPIETAAAPVKPIKTAAAPGKVAVAAGLPAAAPASKPKPIETVPASGVTKANFDRLRSGMTYKQVFNILGENGEELSSSDIAGYSTVMYMWRAGAGIGNMNAMFQNGHLINKAQFGLK